MRNPILILSAVAAVLSTAACGLNPAGPHPKNITNITWSATKAEFTSVADANKKVDIIAQGGWLRVVFDEAGSFTLRISESGGAEEESAGDWSVSSDVMTWFWRSRYSGQTQFDYSLNGDTMTLTGGHIPFDFTPGTFEEATLNLILTNK